MSRNEVAVGTESESAMFWTSRAAGPVIAFRSAETGGGGGGGGSFRGTRGAPVPPPPPPPPPPPHSLLLPNGPSESPAAPPASRCRTASATLRRPRRGPAGTARTSPARRPHCACRTRTRSRRKCNQAYIERHEMLRRAGAGPDRERHRRRLA